MNDLLIKPDLDVMYNMTAMSNEQNLGIMVGVFFVLFLQKVITADGR